MLDFAIENRENCNEGRDWSGSMEDKLNSSSATKRGYILEAKHKLNEYFVHMPPCLMESETDEQKCPPLPEDVDICLQFLLRLGQSFQEKLTASENGTGGNTSSSNNGDSSHDSDDEHSSNRNSFYFTKFLTGSGGGNRMTTFDEEEVLTSLVQETGHLYVIQPRCMRRIVRILHHVLLTLCQQKKYFRYVNLVCFMLEKSCFTVAEMEEWCTFLHSQFSEKSFTDGMRLLPSSGENEFVQACVQMLHLLAMQLSRKTSNDSLNVVKLCQLFASLCDRSAGSVFNTSCAKVIDSMAAISGTELTEKLLIPRFYALSTDTGFNLRKVCAEKLSSMSGLVKENDIRWQSLTHVAWTLLQDEAPWVRSVAYEQLGRFILTFAQPQKTGLRLNEHNHVERLYPDDVFHPLYRSPLHSVIRAGVVNEGPWISTPVAAAGSGGGGARVRNLLVAGEGAVGAAVVVRRTRGPHPGCFRNRASLSCSYVTEEAMPVLPSPAVGNTSITSVDSMESPLKTTEEQMQVEVARVPAKPLHRRRRQFSAGDSEAQQCRNVSVADTFTTLHQRSDASEKPLELSNPKEVSETSVSSEEAVPASDPDVKAHFNTATFWRTPLPEAETDSLTPVNHQDTPPSFTDKSLNANQDVTVITTHNNNHSKNPLIFLPDSNENVVDSSALMEEESEDGIGSKLKPVYEEKEQEELGVIQLPASLSTSSSTHSSGTAVDNGNGNDNDDDDMCFDPDMSADDVVEAMLWNCTAAVASEPPAVLRSSQPHHHHHHHHHHNHHHNHNYPKVDGNQQLHALFYTQMYDVESGNFVVVRTDQLDLSGDASSSSPFLLQMSGVMDDVVRQSDRCRTQDLVPPVLLDYFINTPDSYQLESARLFVAVAYVLGPQYWHVLRPLFLKLKENLDWKIRRCIAFSLFELLTILGPHLAELDILPVLREYSRDVVDVREGILHTMTKITRLLSRWASPPALSPSMAMQKLSLDPATYLKESQPDKARQVVAQFASQRLLLPWLRVVHILARGSSIMPAMFVNKKDNSGRHEDTLPAVVVSVHAAHWRQQLTLLAKLRKCVRERLLSLTQWQTHIVRPLFLGGERSSLAGSEPLVAGVVLPQLNTTSFLLHSVTNVRLAACHLLAHILHTALSESAVLQKDVESSSCSSCSSRSPSPQPPDNSPELLWVRDTLAQVAAMLLLNPVVDSRATVPMPASSLPPAVNEEENDRIPEVEEETEPNGNEKTTTEEVAPKRVKTVWPRQDSDGQLCAWRQRQTFLQLCLELLHQLVRDVSRSAVSQEDDAAAVERREETLHFVRTLWTTFVPHVLRLAVVEHEPVANVRLMAVRTLKHLHVLLTKISGEEDENVQQVDVVLQKVLQLEQDPEVMHVASISPEDWLHWARGLDTTTGAMKDLAS